MSQINSLKNACREQGFRYAIGRLVEEGLIRVPGIRSFYSRLAPKIYQKKYNIGGDWIAPLTVFKLVYIDPAQITHITERSLSLGSGRRNSIGTVLSGSWDESDRELKDEILFSSIQNHFQDDVNWPETKLYQYTLEKIAENESFWHGCENEKEIQKRCKEIDNLYEKIKNEGYQTHQERGTTLSYVNNFLSEILIDINRKGEPLFVDGRHRLAIVKELEYEYVPAFVLVRHRSWMQHRDEIYRSSEETNHFDTDEF